MRRRYAAMMTVLSLIAPFWLGKRAKADKEDPLRVSERFGKTAMQRPEGPLIWMHGASVGETKSLLPLIKEMLQKHPEHSVLVTSGTVTSARLMEESLPDRAFHQYLPLDVPRYVSRFLTHWQPDLAVWMESEIWPNLIFETSKQHIPMALINARMNLKSLKGWEKRRRFAVDIFKCFDVILPSDTQTAEWLSQLLEADIPVLGNLKYDAPTLTYHEKERTTLKTSIGERQIWTAASIHIEEMGTVITAQKSLKKKACLVLVPRHPSDSASRMLVADYPDLTFSIRSKGQLPAAETDIYLFDTFGEMGLAYSLANLAVVGGSLDSKLMGHNPLEPVRLSIPTLTGPYFSSFSEIYAPFLENKAILAIEEPDNLAQIIDSMLNTPETLESLSQKASECLAHNSAVLDRTVEALETLMKSKAHTKRATL
jgi:3-deoxy-D-manno-octulosonic-acid transferase